MDAFFLLSIAAAHSAFCRGGHKSHAVYNALPDKFRKSPETDSHEGAWSTGEEGHAPRCG
jgi:hypothetical protein